MNKLLERRKGLLAALQNILDGCDKEGRNPTTDEESKIETLRSEITDVNQQIENRKQIDDLIADANADQTAIENAATTPAYQSAPAATATASAPADHINRGLSVQDQRDINSFSFTRACRPVMGIGVAEGIEAEMLQEGLKEKQSSGAPFQSNVVIPTLVLNHGLRFSSQGLPRVQNDMTTTAAQGGNLIETTLRAPIDVLYDQLVLTRLGATFLTGLKGNVGIPQLGAAAQPTHKAETAAADEVQATTTDPLLTMSPNRLPVVSEVTTQLLQQSELAIEPWLRNHLMQNTAIGMQVGAINGSGSSNQPTGILNTAGLTLVAHGTDGGQPTRNTVTQLMGTVDVANAAQGSLGFLTNGKVVTTLKETKTDAGSGQFVIGLADNDTIAGTPAGKTNSVPSNLTKGSGTNLSALVYGNFADLFIGQWGGLGVLVDPYTKSDTGLVRLTLEAFYDVACVRVASFAASNDLITTI